jgi:TldD protein
MSDVLSNSLRRIPSSRREFLQTFAVLSATTAFSTIYTRPAYAWFGPNPESVPPIDDPRIRELVSRGLDAAKQHGATYADIRLTYTRQRDFANGITTTETLAAGVRVLVDGYWGFASSPVWHHDEIVRLAKNAVALAHTNRNVPSLHVGLAEPSQAESGHWSMPVQIDPFDVPWEEVLDFIGGVSQFITAHNAVPSPIDVSFMRQDKAFGATNGSYCTQQLYRTSAQAGLTVGMQGRKVSTALEGMSPAGAGWEYLRNGDHRETILRTIEQLKYDLSLPVKPVDIGRFPVVLDAHGVAQIASSTIGAATELDRAMGLEANADGTSYIDRPKEMLGSLKIGGSALNVTADRNTEGAVATVQWDDEGVRPEPFALVKDGILANMQTTRESAEWIAEYARSRGEVPRSRGCASAPSGLEPPLSHTTNLSIAPSQSSADFDDLIRDVDRGIAFRELMIDSDFQQSGGLGIGTAYEISGGKRVAIMSGAAILFRASELWVNMETLGGATSTKRFGIQRFKGEPPQESYHTVTAPPALFRNVSVIDAWRRG